MKQRGILSRAAPRTRGGGTTPGRTAYHTLSEYMREAIGLKAY
jgi:hypothetical protein